MSQINFYLDKPASKVPTTIFLFFNFKGKRLKISTDEKILPKDWNPVEQVARRSLSGNVVFNLHLKKFREDVEKIYRELILSGTIVTPDKLKIQILLKVKNKSALEFFDCFEKFMNDLKTSRRKNTINKYSGTLKHLQKYRVSRRVKIDFNDIGGEFYRKFSDYLINDIQNSNNTVVKNLKVIKTFMSYANKVGWTNNKDYLDTGEIKEQEGEVYFLTLEQLMHLYNLKIKDKGLQKVRDVFCFGCFTGLRYSDIEQLSRDHISDDSINLVHIKGSDMKTNKIPLNKFAKAILNKYNDHPIKPLPVESNAKMNKQLKELGSLAGLDEVVVRTRYKGAERIEEKLKKYEILTTHIARKTFITNSIYLNMNSEVIMSITGQKSRKAFKRYFDIVSEVKQSEMEKTWGAV